MGSFSTPGEGMHSLRVFDIAIIDLFLTVIVALAISRKKFIIVFTILIVLSIVMHTAMGIRTRTNSFLFKAPDVSKCK